MGRSSGMRLGGGRSARVALGSPLRGGRSARVAQRLLPRSHFHSFISDDSGSLSLAITSLFLLTLLLAFSIIDISGAFLAKRELINIGEAAISRSAHHIDTERYYSGPRSGSGLNGSEPSYLLPIDCASAEESLGAEIAGSRLNGSKIAISSFSCDGDQLHTILTSQVKPLLALPLLPGSVMNKLLLISASISASNVIG